MKKICMLVTNSVRKDPRVRKEAISAVNAGYEVVVIGIMDANYDDSFVDSVPYRIVLINEIKNNYRRFTFQWLLKGISKTCYYNKKFVEYTVNERPDLIHSNDYDTLNAGYKASRKCKCEQIYDSHEVATGSILAERFKFVKAWIKFNEGRIIRKVKATISVSNAAADYLASLYHVSRPTVVTNCPCFVTSKQREDNQIVDVLYQGIMSPGRGYEEFVESAKYITNNAHLTIRGYGEIKDKLINMAEDMGLNDRITFENPVEISELISAASKSSVGVVLTKPVCNNYKLTVSNKLFEYIQARIPVILSDVPEHRYLLEKYKFGILLDEISPNAIANAINTISSNNEIYNAMKVNVEIAAKELCWETFEKSLLELYE